MYKYVVAIKEYAAEIKPIYLEQVNFDSEPGWKDILFAVTGKDYFGELPEYYEYEEWILDMPNNFEDAKNFLTNGDIEVKILKVK